jgi:hypothetical protein
VHKNYRKEIKKITGDLLQEIENEKNEKKKVIDSIPGLME